MKKKVVVVGGVDETVGFRLAGVAETYSADAKGLADTLLEKDAIIFITEEAEARLGESLDRIRARNIVQRIPGEGGYTRLKEIIKSTIGFELRK